MASASSELATYLLRLSARLGAILGEDLLGLYTGGSVALGGYEPGRSDVDVAAVAGGALSLESKRRIVEELRHESLPCPARGLELVVYPEWTVSVPSADPGYELELNTGSGLAFHVAFDPEQANGRHWYVIDRAILARHGVTLLGPPAAGLVADVPRELVVPALLESVRWYAAAQAPRHDAVLNACRALRYVAEGRWSSKDAAGRWALDRVDDRALVADARRAHRSGAPLDGPRVTRFLDSVARELERDRGHVR